MGGGGEEGREKHFLLNFSSNENILPDINLPFQQNLILFP